MSKLEFPDGFMWGASTAAHQIEGYQNNDWTGWDERVADDLARTAKQRLGRLHSWGYVREEAESPTNYIAGEAANHYHRFEKDFDLLQSLNLSAFRFSIEWARIEPEPGLIDYEAIEHYRKVLQSLQRRNITPFVTLHHFTNPKWFAYEGDWSNEQASEQFARYAEVIAKELGQYITYWITINEPGSYVLMKHLGGDIWPAWPKRHSSLHLALKTQKHMAEAHILARERIRKYNPQAMVGMSHGVPVFHPGRRDPLSLAAAKLVEYMGEDRLMRRLRGHEDFLSLHYYNRTFITSKLAPVNRWYDHDDTGAQSDMGWGIYPKGIYEITQAAKKYDLPIVIAENGLPDGRDELRQQFIHDHLYWLYRSIEDGADIRGYLHWSLLDNYEWSEGFWPKFGLVEVNQATKERKVRDSAYYYSSIAKNNSLSTE